MVKEDTPKRSLSREVYARLGLAMYQSQVVEDGFVNLVMIVGVRDGSFRFYEEAKAAEAKLVRQTMGAVKKVLMSRMPEMEHLDDLLERAVSLRNFLAHQYFRQRAGAFKTETGQLQMVEELEKAIEFFVEVDRRLTDLTNEVVEAMGRRERKAEAMEEAGFGDPLPGLEQGL
jgi:hypothetical protein